MPRRSPDSPKTPRSGVAGYRSGRAKEGSAVYRPSPKKLPRASGGKGKPPIRPHVTTLWDYPSQNYPSDTGHQGDENYPGVTPSHVIWNVIHRYSKEGELIVDPFCGSGTTLDVAADLNRRARGFDLAPTRADIERADARELPVENGQATAVFMDPPYGTHIDYSDDPRCIGKLDASGDAYYAAMDRAFAEAWRILKSGGTLAVYVSDSHVLKGQGKGFWPIGFELFARLRAGGFEPIDIVAIVRRNKTLEQGNYRKAADEGGFFLRGFNYLLLFTKPGKPEKVSKPRAAKSAKEKDWFKYRKPKG